MGELVDFSPLPHTMLSSAPDFNGLIHTHRYMYKHTHLSRAVTSGQGTPRHHTDTTSFCPCTHKHHPHQHLIDLDWLLPALCLVSSQTESRTRCTDNVDFIWLLDIAIVFFKLCVFSHCHQTSSSLPFTPSPSFAYYLHFAGFFFFSFLLQLFLDGSSVQKPSPPHEQNSLRKEWSETGVSLKMEKSIPNRSSMGLSKVNVLQLKQKIQPVF